MKDLLVVIRDCLKDVHIEDGRKDSFDRVCLMLNEQLTLNSVFKMGERAGRDQIREGLKTLLDIREYNCDG